MKKRQMQIEVRTLTGVVQLADGRLSSQSPISEPSTITVQQLHALLSNVSMAELKRMVIEFNYSVLLVAVQDAADPTAEHYWLMDPASVSAAGKIPAADVPETSAVGLLSTGQSTTEH